MRMIRRPGSCARAVLTYVLLATTVLLLATLGATQGIVLAQPGTESTSDETYEFVLSWDSAPLPGLLSAPGGVAVDSKGDVYVTDVDNQRIQKFGPTGTFIREWGEYGYGSGPAEMLEPWDIAVDTHDQVYVADREKRGIKKFASDGTYLCQIGNRFFQTVDVDTHGNVYAMEHNAYLPTVHKYDAGGQLVAEWSAGVGYVAVDLGGYVYASDVRNDEISKFDLNGNLLATWFVDCAPVGLAVDTSGYVYASCANGIAKFDPSGREVLYWGGQGNEGSGDGQFRGPAGIGVGPDGRIYVADGGNDRIQVFTSAGVFVRKWGSPSTRSRLRHPEGVTVGPDGTVFVVDTMADRVQSFTAQGAYLTRWDTGDYPSGISTDALGSVYVCGPGVPDSGSRTSYSCPWGIEKYSSTGSKIANWGRGGPCGNDDGQTNWASGVAVGPRGNVYVADTQNNRIQVFDAAGVFLAKWGSSGSGNGQFWSPQGVALTADGSIYVADTGNNRIQKFSSQLSFVTKWGGYGEDEGSFRHPKGIAVDGSGNVYVADAFNDRIQKFDSDGHFITSWGSYGHGDGEFDDPLGVAVDAGGLVYVADSDNNRIQVFEKLASDLSGSTKLVDKMAAQPGDALIYTVVVRNSGGLDAVAVTMTDALPPSTTYSTGTLWASNGTYGEENGVVSWTGSVGTAQDVTIVYSATLDGDMPRGTVVTNASTISGGNASFVRSAMTIVDPYQVYLPVLLRT